MTHKVTCREVIDFLWAYESGEMASDKRARADLHLETCQGCQDYLASYRQTIQLEKQAWEPVLQEVPEDLILAILDNQQKKS